MNFGDMHPMTAAVLVCLTYLTGALIISKHRWKSCKPLHNFNIGRVSTF